MKTRPHPSQFAVLTALAVSGAASTVGVKAPILHPLHKKEMRRSHSLYVGNPRSAMNTANPGRTVATESKQEANAACGKGFARSI